MVQIDFILLNPWIWSIAFSSSESCSIDYGQYILLSLQISFVVRWKKTLGASFRWL